ncbi:MAG: histidinol phosphatase [Saprospiraceae bacterium]|nr:histidinol phosphatase [Saprospiraceae bacterium]
MLSFLRKKHTLATDYSGILNDIHAHLIPGIDDGPKEMEESLQLIRGLESLGYRHLTATPHVMSDYYPNSRDYILESHQKLVAAAKEAGIGAAIGVAAEYYMDSQFLSVIENDQVLPLPGNMVLIEMSFVSPPPNLYHFIFRLQTKNYQPVLAHPERYLFLKKNYQEYERLKEYGVRFQLNLLSLTGHYGAPVAEMGWKLLKNKMIDYVGTDVHHLRHVEILKAALQDKRIAQTVAEYGFLNAELG